MPIPRLATLIGGLLLSKGGRRMAGRHAGKLALVTLAYQLWEQRQYRGVPGQKPGHSSDQTQRPSGGGHPRQRWSGRTR